MLVSRISSTTWNALTFSPTCAETSTEAGIRNVVRRTSHRLMPSTPRCSVAPTWGIQRAWSSSWGPATEALKWKTMNSEVTKVTSVDRSAAVRMRRVASFGMTPMIRAPARGRRSVTVSSGKWVTAGPPSASSSVDPQEKDGDDEDDPAEHRHDVAAYQAALHPAQ